MTSRRLPDRGDAVEQEVDAGEELTAVVVLAQPCGHLVHAPYGFIDFFTSAGS